eukprot:6211809-Amphidinium_carterae.1
MSKCWKPEFVRFLHALQVLTNQSPHHVAHLHMALAHAHHATFVRILSMLRRSSYTSGQSLFYRCRTHLLWRHKTTEYHMTPSNPASGPISWDTFSASLRLTLGSTTAGPAGPAHG